MATEQTLVAPEAMVFPWQGLNDPSREISVVPRSEVRFQVTDGVITASGVGDDQELIVQMTLPVNFSYAVSEVFMRILPNSADATNNFSDVAEMVVADSGPSATREIGTFMPSAQALTSAPIQNVGGIRCYSWPVLPKVIFKPQSSAGVPIFSQIRVTNDTDNDGTYNFDLFARFYTFDVDQSLHYAVNTPVLER